jgi:hypothetical protein
MAPSPSVSRYASHSVAGRMGTDGVVALRAEILLNRNFFDRSFRSHSKGPPGLDWSNAFFFTARYGMG